jgi:hypothetical protein
MDADFRWVMVKPFLLDNMVRIIIAWYNSKTDSFPNSSGSGCQARNQLQHMVRTWKIPTQRPNTFELGWNSSAYFFIPWFKLSFNFVASRWASPKSWCKSILITLNPVGILWFDQPITSHLPPLHLFLLPLVILSLLQQQQQQQPPAPQLYEALRWQPRHCRRATATGRRRPRADAGPGPPFI